MFLKQLWALKFWRKSIYYIKSAEKNAIDFLSQIVFLRTLVASRVGRALVATGKHNPGSRTAGALAVNKIGMGMTGVLENQSLVK